MLFTAFVLLAGSALASLQAESRPQDAPSLEERIADLRDAVRGKRDPEIIEHATALGELGAKAAAAIPWLWQGMEHEICFYTGRCDEVVPAIAQALRRIGPRACLELPDAGRWLTWTGWDRKVPLATSAAELLELSEHPVQEVRQLAARELARLHPASLEVVRARLTGDNLDRRVHAAAAAGAFRAAASSLVAPLARCLESDDPRLRYHACESLGELLPASAAALIAACGNADPRVRREALLALERGLDPRLAVTPLPELELGGWGCYGWERDGPPGLDSTLSNEETLDALAARLDDPVEGNRILALMIFAKLGEATPGGIERIRQTAADEEVGVRVWSVHALRRVQPRPWDILLDLRTAHGGDESAPAAERTLEELVQELDAGQVFKPVDGSMGWELPPTGGSDPRYETALELVRRFLPELIERSGAGDLAAMSVLARARWVIERHVRTLVAVASVWPASEADELLGNVGPAALCQVSAGWLAGFWTFCGGSEEIVFFELGKVLPSLGPCSIPVLTFGMEHGEFFAPSAFYLSRIEGAAAGAAPALIRALRIPRSSGVASWFGVDWESVPAKTYEGDDFWGKENSERRDWLEIVCRRMGPELIPGLIDALGDEHAIVRARACRGLAAIEVASSEVISALATALVDDQAHVRSAAARTLQRLQPADEDLLRRCAETVRSMGERP